MFCKEHSTVDVWLTTLNKALIRLWTELLIDFEELLKAP